MAILTVLAAAPAWGEKPQRVVSTNLCLDELVLLLAPRERIASVSFLVAAPALSPLAERARGITLNRGRAEEILPLAPDLVLADEGGREAARLLARLGVRVAVIARPASFAEVRATVRRVATLLGETARGAALIGRFDDGLARLAGEHRGGARPRAVIYAANGYATGPGTLGDAVLAAAGFANLARQGGRRGVQRMALELLIARRPDMVVVVQPEAAGPAPALALLAHPAARRALGQVPKVTVNDTLWSCFTPPHLLAAAEQLARHRAE